MELGLLGIARIGVLSVLVVFAGYLALSIFQASGASYIHNINFVSCFNSSNCTMMEGARLILTNGSSNVTTFITYKGNISLHNFTLLEKLPKSFSNDANRILVDASGASLEILERDPVYLFTYPEISPRQQLVITYKISWEVDVNVIKDMTTEVNIYTPSGDSNGGSNTICTPGERICFGSDLNECNPEGLGWNVLESCQNGCAADACIATPQEQPIIPEVSNDMLTTIAIAIIIIAGLILIAKVI